MQWWRCGVVVMCDPLREAAELSQRVVPKHEAQSMGEITCVRKWLDGYAGDGVRRLATSSALPGDHPGQETKSYRWPYGATAVITPFNFPLEIPALQVRYSAACDGAVLAPILPRGN
eukprot:SAG25_NODE_650_length_6188_cov_4.455740_11_plen_117_part_00